MRERPILFSAPMVRAILAGTKTQTRRAVKEEALKWLEEPIGFTPEYVAAAENGLCPYGQSGDRLWVRENGWERPERTARMMRDGADTWEPYYYDADGITDTECEDFRQWGFKRRPSIHMPRWASRILLEVVSVRIERLQDISESDAEAEGAPFELGELERLILGAKAKYRSGFVRLWQSINGPDSWAANPWVWVIEFKGVQP